VQRIIFTSSFLQIKLGRRSTDGHGGGGGDSVITYRGSTVSSNLLTRNKKERTNNKMVMYVSKIPGDSHASFHRDSQGEKHRGHPAK
jgi:hypothetical protein